MQTLINKILLIFGVVNDFSYPSHEVQLKADKILYNIKSDLNDLAGDIPKQLTMYENIIENSYNLDAKTLDAIKIVFDKDDSDNFWKDTIQIIIDKSDDNELSEEEVKYVMGHIKANLPTVAHNGNICVSIINDILVGLEELSRGNNISQGKCLDLGQSIYRRNLEAIGTKNSDLNDNIKEGINLINKACKENVTDDPKGREVGCNIYDKPSVNGVKVTEYGNANNYQFNEL